MSNFEKIKAKNIASHKQCKDCMSYIENYKDDYTIRHFNYGKVSYRPACSFGNSYGFVSHNPARLCRHYKKNNTTSFLALQGITAKVNQVLKLNEVKNEQ